MARRQGGVKAAVEIAARLYMIGKQAQLGRRAATLTLQARNRQTGFLSADFGDRLGASLDLIGALRVVWA